MSIAILLLLQLAVLAYAVVAGVFLAFSDFIMRSLAITSGAGGVEAMQAINREVFRWIFMTLFLGMAAGSIALAVYSWFWVDGLASTLIIAAALVYLIGCFGVTVAFNVPMNEALAGMSSPAEATREYWLRTYVPRWTFWNSIRTGASAISAGLLLLGLMWMTRPQI